MQVWSLISVYEGVSVAKRERLQLTPFLLWLALGHLHVVMPRTPCLSASVHVKPHGAVTGARTDVSASLSLCFSFPPWSQGFLRLKGLFWISSCGPSVCQQRAVGIAVLGVNGERRDCIYPMCFLLTKWSKSLCSSGTSIPTLRSCSFL